MRLEPTRRIMRCLALGLLACVLAEGGDAVGGPGAVDVALVLAVDVSNSIDDGEYQLQRQGYAAAFRDARVADAIHLGAKGRIAVTLMQWASASEQRQVIQWTEIADTEDAQAFARALDAAPRTAFPGGSTSVSGAITGALGLIGESGFSRARQVIDISADGSNNNGRPPEMARAEALAAGVTVNGLVILADELLLDRYFEERVMGGPGAFVIAISSSAQIRDALVQKLVREIAGPGSVPGSTALAWAGGPASPLRAKPRATSFAAASPDMPK